MLIAIAFGVKDVEYEPALLATVKAPEAQLRERFVLKMLNVEKWVVLDRLGCKFPAPVFEFLLDHHGFYARRQRHLDGMQVAKRALRI